MRQALILLIVMMGANFSYASKAKSCESLLLAFNTWEDEVKGEIVTKHSYFGITDWDPNSEFEGIILTKTASRSLKNPVLELEYVPRSKGQQKIEIYRDPLPFEGDASLLHFDDLRAKEFFTMKNPGFYIVRLKAENKLLCEAKYTYSLGD